MNRTILPFFCTTNQFENESISKPILQNSSTEGKSLAFNKKQAKKAKDFI